MITAMVSRIITHKKPLDKKFNPDYYMGRQIKDDYAHDHLRILRKTGPTYKNASVATIDIDAAVKQFEHKKDTSASLKDLVTVLKEDTFQHLINNYKEGDNILVLVFAAGTNRCGGMVNGKNAQEEQLCRMGDVPHILEKFGVTEKLYWDRDRCCVLVRNAAFLLDSDLNELKTPVKVDFLFAAAPRLDEGERPSKDHKEYVDKLIETTFITLANNGFEKKVYNKAYLGALGCGCFHWDAKYVAGRFLEYHKTYAKELSKCHVYHVIKDKIGYNYEAFAKTFS
jgi:uncharacterized protein (TIGR02452 family)